MRLGIDQDGNAMDEGVNTGTIPVNECYKVSDNRVDNTVVHSECPLCICWNQWNTSDVHISYFKTSDQDKDNSLAEMTQLRSSNAWMMRIHLRQTLPHSILLVLVLLHMSQGMLICSTVRTTDPWFIIKKVSDFVFKKSNHAVAPTSKYPVRAT